LNKLIVSVLPHILHNNATKIAKRCPRTNRRTCKHKCSKVTTREPIASKECRNQRRWTKIQNRFVKTIVVCIWTLLHKTVFLTIVMCTLVIKLHSKQCYLNANVLLILTSCAGYTLPWFCVCKFKCEIIINCLNRLHGACLGFWTSDWLHLTTEWIKYW